MPNFLGICHSHKGTPSSAQQEVATDNNTFTEQCTDLTLESDNTVKLNGG